MKSNGTHIFFGPNHNGIPIFYGGQCVGVVVDGVFYRDAHDSHFLRTPPAIAFHACVLEKIAAAGGRFYAVTAVDRIPLVRYFISAADFEAKQFGPFDRMGTGKQFGVVLSSWSAELLGTDKPAADKPAADKPAA